MDNNGWVKLHRKTIDCGFFNNPNLSHFWVWCLLKASHKEYTTTVGFQSVTLKPGQFIFGRHVASIETGLSERTIRTCIEHLTNMGNSTIKATNKFSIITVCKWDTYQNTESTNDQQSDTQTTSRRPADDHKQECKEQKNVKNKTIVDFDLIWNKYPNKDGRKQAERHFNATVKSLDDLNDITTALENYLKSPSVIKGFIKNGSTWFNNWKDWLNPSDSMLGINDGLTPEIRKSLANLK